MKNGINLVQKTSRLPKMNSRDRVDSAETKSRLCLMFPIVVVMKARNTIKDIKTKTKQKEKENNRNEQTKPDWSLTRL